MGSAPAISPDRHASHAPCALRHGAINQTLTETPPPLDADAQAAFIAKSKALAPEYKTELLPPPGTE
jgi:hypothetical protein